MKFLILTHVVQWRGMFRYRTLYSSGQTTIYNTRTTMKEFFREISVGLLAHSSEPIRVPVPVVRGQEKSTE